MEQPDHHICSGRDEESSSPRYDVWLERDGSRQWAMNIASGSTELIAHKAAVRRLKRLLREEERAVAKLEKGCVR